MRIADVLFRQGHLSDETLTAVLLDGDRPAHLDRCDQCSGRLRELSRWLDDLRSEALAAADEAFPPERLALQQAQILRRLEQLDEPSRVIAFPAHVAAAPRTDTERRVAPAWVGVAAAAGLVMGLIGGQVWATLEPQRPAPPAVQADQPETMTPPGQPVNAELLDYDFERHVPDALVFFDEITPALTQGQYAAR